MLNNRDKRNRKRKRENEII